MLATPYRSWPIFVIIIGNALCILKEMSVSSTFLMAESRDQTTNFMFDRLRPCSGQQELANPGNYVSDTLYELLQNITID